MRAVDRRPADVLRRRARARSPSGCAPPAVAALEAAERTATRPRAIAPRRTRSPTAGCSSSSRPRAARSTSRSLCLAREMLGYVSPRADSIFAVQGLGTHPIAARRQRRAARAARRRSRAARAIAAFALTEPEAGSDVAAIADARGAGRRRLPARRREAVHLEPRHRRSRDRVRDDRSGAGAAGLTAFWVPLDAPGVDRHADDGDRAASDRRARAARRRRAGDGARSARSAQGMKLAMQTLDAFRVSVGAAAVGMARRALDEALAFVTRARRSSASRSPSSSSCRRTSPTWRSTSMPRACSCCARRTARTPPAAASRPRCRSRSSARPRPRSA